MKKPEEGEKNSKWGNNCGVVRARKDWGGGQNLQHVTEEFQRRPSRASYVTISELGAKRTEHMVIWNIDAPRGRHERRPCGDFCSIYIAAALLLKTEAESIGREETKQSSALKTPPRSLAVTQKVAVMNTRAWRERAAFMAGGQRSS